MVPTRTRNEIPFPNHSRTRTISADWREYYKRMYANCCFVFALRPRRLRLRKLTVCVTKNDATSIAEACCKGQKAAQSRRARTRREGRLVAGFRLIETARYLVTQTMQQSGTTGGFREYVESAAAAATANITAGRSLGSNLKSRRCMIPRRRPNYHRHAMKF